MDWTRRGLIATGTVWGLGASSALAGASRPGVGGFSPQALEAMAAPGRQAVASGDVPGVISLVWRKGELAMTDLAGLQDVGRKRPMERDAIFGLASMTKPVTVAAALSLMQQGVIKLDDPITKWAPEFANMRVLRRPGGPLDDTYPAPRAITILDLMTHTSGLGYGAQTAGPLGGALMQKMGLGLESSLPPDEWMKTLAELPLAYAPGDRFNYGHSIDVLASSSGARRERACARS